MSHLSDDLKRSPELFAHTWDAGADKVLLVRLGEAELAAASFLDQRVLGPQTPGQWLSRRELMAGVAEAGLSERLGWIFHIGHVGSTLVSRLVGALPSGLSLREPAPLRTLAQAELELVAPESPIAPETWAQTLDGFLKLWSRPFRPEQRAVVKATSVASELAAGLMGRASKPSAVMMTATPEAYVASILGGPNSRVEAKALAGARLKRLHRRLGDAPWRLWEMDEGQVVAMSWAAETTALKAAEQAAGGGRSLWLDFDRFLEAPAEGLAAVCAQLGLEAAPGEIGRLVASPLMRQYSKAPEHAYDAGLRREVLAAGRAENPEAFRSAMDWLDKAAADHPQIAAARVTDR